MGNVPKLRFSEFSVEWKNERTGKLFPKIRNGFVGTATPHYVDDGVLYLQGKNIKNGQVLENGYIKISEEFHQKQIKSQLQNRDIVMVQSGHVGECAQITGKYVGANCHALLVMSPIEKIETKFFVYLYYSDAGKRMIHRIKTGNTIEHILSSDLKEESLFVPELPEQQKIAAFLSAVDTKIEHLTKKEELLQQYKKGVMQKLFSQEIRFKADDGSEFPEWEMRKFGEVFERITTKNKENNQNVLTISAQQGLVNQEEYFNKSVAAQDVTGYYLLHKDDFAYNKSYSKGYPLGAIKRLTKYEKGVVSTLYICFRAKKCVNSFAEQFFENGGLNREIHKIAQEGARNHGLLNMSVVEFFKDIELPLPCREEQYKIAELLTNIDLKIEQANRQLTSAKNFKKGLLQQMFV